MSMIYGKRVRLRSAERSDLEKFVEWINDPEVTAGLTLFLPMSSVDEEKWFDTAMQKPQEEKPLVIDMKDGTDWRLIGNSSFFDFDWVARAAEVGIMIGDKTVWNQGYGTEVMSSAAAPRFRDPEPESDLFASLCRKQTRHPNLRKDRIRA